jgi:electron transport complex protein RnfB
MNLISRIDALLPQTQCGKCGHPGCRPYAEGIAAGEPINQCPPGGEETLAALSHLLQVPLIALDTGRGQARAVVAYIREAECIGCTKCIQACPVDAIVGAARLMHTVLIDECTGCDLCVAPCPVDCIDLVPVPLERTVPLLGSLASDAPALQARQVKRDQAPPAGRPPPPAPRGGGPAARTRPAPNLPPPLSTPSSIPLATSGVDERAVKQARIAVAMSRAQFNKSIRAFGSPPTAEQHARLSQLHQELESADEALARLLDASQESPAP